jgi:hypothetical protein
MLFKLVMRRGRPLSGNLSLRRFVEAGTGLHGRTQLGETESRSDIPPPSVGQWALPVGAVPAFRSGQAPGCLRRRTPAGSQGLSGTKVTVTGRDQGPGAGPGSWIGPGRGWPVLGPGTITESGFPDFPKSRPNRESGQNPEYFPDSGPIPAHWQSGWENPAIFRNFPKSGRRGGNRSARGISGSASGSLPVSPRVHTIVPARCAAAGPSESRTHGTRVQGHGLNILNELSGKCWQAQPASERARDLRPPAGESRAGRNPYRGH